MLLKISLDDDSHGDMAAVVCSSNQEKLTLASQLTGVRALHVRSKTNKVVNGYAIEPKESLHADVQKFIVRSTTSQGHLATLTLDMSTRKYSCERNQIERKRGLSVEFEISVQPLRKKA